VTKNFEGLINGELNQKAITGPKGIPAANKAAINGMTPQEHNGTVAPTSADPIIATGSLRLKTALIRSEKPDTVTHAEIETLIMKKGRMDQIALTTKDRFENTSRQKRSELKPGMTPVPKIRTVRLIKAANPHTQYVTGFNGGDTWPVSSKGLTDKTISLL